MDDKENKLFEYVPGSSAADSLVIHWYYKMVASGDLNNLFYSMTVAQFIKHLDGRRLIFKANATGIWFAAWYEVAFNGAFLALWTEKAMRGKKAHLQSVEQAFEYGLDRWPILLGTTRQERILDEHRRLGYTVIGKIPGLWYGDDVWIMYLTRESYMNRSSRLVKRPPKDINKENAA